MSYNSPELIRNLLPRMEDKEFDREVFDKTGVFTIRNALSQDLVQYWKGEWDIFYYEQLANGRNVNINNPVDLKEPLPPSLTQLYKDETLLDYAQQVFGNDIALFHYRFVIKDKFSTGEVFLHHDYCYHIGMPFKASFFVPLAYTGKENGGLTFYPGTQAYGFLGDAGEINPDQFDETWPSYTPELNPGDFVIMNSLVWHCSGANISGHDRIIADINYQPANDPSGKELLRGEWKTDFRYGANKTPNDFFRRCRVSKIIDLTAKLNAKELNR